MVAKYPAIPEPTLDPASLRDASLSLKQAFEILTGQRGNPDYAAVIGPLPDPPPPVTTLPANSISVTPAGNIASTDVQAALQELDSEKVAKAGDTMSGHLTLPTGPAAANAVRKDYVDAGDASQVNYTAQTLTAPQQTQSRTNIGAFGRVVVQKFTAGGTYTPTAGMLYCIIECVGGGGGGGGGASNTTVCTGGGGGGGGGYSRLIASAATIGASRVVTIGAGGAASGVGTASGGNGGDTSVGSICIAKGGSGGAGGGTASVGQPGAGGIVGTGDLSIAGSSGRVSFFASSVSGSVFFTGGDGGSSYFGAGAISNAVGGAALTGSTGSLYGGGGSGAQVNLVASAAAGGAGAAGIAIVTEFCT